MGSNEKTVENEKVVYLLGLFFDAQTAARVLEMLVFLLQKMEGISVAGGRGFVNFDLVS